MESNKDKFADRGSERMILSGVLQNPDRLIDVSAKVTADDFLSKNHRALFSILSSLYEQGVKSFDLMAVANEASASDLLPLIGGAEYIDALMSSPVNAENLEVYLYKVLDCSSKYRLYVETTHIQESVLASLGPQGDTTPADELIARAGTRLLDVSMDLKQVEDAVDISSGLQEYLDYLSSSPTSVRGLSTNIPLLDECINGLIDGTLTIIAARQKGGKSTLLMNMAANMAYVQQKKVLYIDTEINKKEMQTRLVSHLSQVPERVITNGRFLDKEIWSTAVGQAAGIIHGGNLFYKYMPGFSMDAVKNMVRKFRAREGIDAFFFDYIKLPEVSTADSFKEHQLLGNITTGLKDLAGKLDIPGIAAAQIKRGDTLKPKTRFHDSDVADSDRIGRYCDTLIALAMKSAKEREEDGESCGTHRLQVLLARRGKANFHGIDLHCKFPQYTLTQAMYQSSGPTALGQDEF